MTSSASSVIPHVRDRTGNDPIFIWLAEANKRAAEGDSIVNATIGSLMDDEGRLCTLPTVIETISNLLTECGGYAPIAGLPPYREAVVQDLFGDGPLSRQAVAVATAGGTGAVYVAVQNFIESGQQMLVPNYFWGPYREITAHAGRGLDPFPMFRADGAFDIEGMAAALDRHISVQGRALVVLNFPCHNPTGYTLSSDEWRRIAEVIDRAGARAPVTVLIDAAYMEFGGDAARSWINFVPSLLRNATVLVAWTASKSMAQYGARVGALVALHRDPTELTQIENAIAYTCRSTWSNCNHVGQRAVTQLLTDPELSERVRTERGRLADLLQARIEVFNEHAAAAKLPTPRFDAGFFVTVFTPDQNATAAAMRERGVYGVPIPGAVRLALCATPAAEIPRLVEAAEAGVAAAV